MDVFEVYITTTKTVSMLYYDQRFIHISLFDLFSSFAIIPAYFLMLMFGVLPYPWVHRAHFVGYNFFGFIYYGQFIMDIIPVWLFFGSIMNWCRLDWWLCVYGEGWSSFFFLRILWILFMLTRGRVSISIVAYCH